MHATGAVLYNKKLCSCLEPLLLHICVSASYCTRRFFSCENVTYSLLLSVNFVLFDFLFCFFLFCLILFLYRKWTKNSRNTKKSSVCGRRRPRLHKTEYVGYCSSYLISVYNYVLSHASSYETKRKQNWRINS